MNETAAVIASVCVALAGAAEPPESAWKPAKGALATRWASEVSPTNVWPEYPRPAMVRKEWENLNGLWNYAVTPALAEKPQQATGEILVPFPIESSLSGVGKALQPEEALWYWRTFTVPQAWKGRVVRLHFGAVDWHAAVEVNGVMVGEHVGGYAPFWIDLKTLKAGENTLVVKVIDPTDTGGQPRGKQWLNPHGIWYTPTSGIWQTVWMEPVGDTSMLGVQVSADRSGSAFVVQADVRTAQDAEAGIIGLEVEVLADGKTVAKERDERTPVVRVTVPSARAWSPEDPYLYDIKARLLLRGKPVDEVASYAAMREVSLGKDSEGIPRLMLNGAPIFHYGPLDQGFWPDGLYTPPTEAAMKFDIEAVKKMGGNMLRKHVKVEPQRFYYWCDRMGVMVWQDIPSPFFKGGGDLAKAPELSDSWKANFEQEMRAIMGALRVHPSIVMWVPFNEGWGQNDIEWSRGMAQLVKQIDGTRLVNNATGWTDMGVGDTTDVHVYPGPGMAATERVRASVLGEFGGLGLPVDGHTWLAKNNWGYVSYKNTEELTDAYVGLMRRMPVLIAKGLCAAVYTQTSDVENEVNGWLTYDREVWKIDPVKASAATRPLYGPPARLHVLVGDASNGQAGVWRYTTQQPAEAWHEASFDDSGWKEGPGGLGTKGTPGAHVGTEWKTADVWIRRHFDLPAQAPASPHLSIHHDEDVQVYINGSLAAEMSGYTQAYDLVALSPEAAKLLKAGDNVIAIHCHQKDGGQYVDCGLVDVAPGVGK